MEKIQQSTQETPQLLRCDYLVVGAGTAGLSFCDTILTLTQQDDTQMKKKTNPPTLIVVDRNSKPGGHWNHAYPFVRLHQSSCYYGINSLTLGNHLDDDGNEIYDVHDRATGHEILDYYQRACEKFVATKRVSFFFNAHYIGKEEDLETTETKVLHSSSQSKMKSRSQSKWTRHKIVVDDSAGTCARDSNTQHGEEDSKIIINNNNKNNKRVLWISCRKLVTVATDVRVPSMRQPLIPVHERVHFGPPNDLASKIGKQHIYQHYIVMGNGKSGIDAIVHLLWESKIPPSCITWIVSRDAWYFLRDSFQDYYRALALFGRLTSQPTVRQVFLRYEADGLMGRLDSQIWPTVFKGAMIGHDEFQAIRSIRNVVRCGKALAIHHDVIQLERGSLRFDPSNTCLVDCMVENQYGYTFPADFTIFGRNRITLGPEISMYSPSFSSAIVAFLETCVPEDDTDGDNTKKNDYCYFLRGPYSQNSHLESYVGAYYMDTKTLEALWKLQGGEKFVLESRLFDAAPMHHEGGIQKMMWEWFLGPHKLAKVGRKLVHKIETQAYDDLDHAFGIEAFWEEKRARKKRRKRAKWARWWGVPTS